METPNTIVHIAHVRVSDRDYNVSVSQNRATLALHIFKYNDYTCDYLITDSQWEAQQFISAPLWSPPKLK